MNRLLRSMSPSMVVALIALFVALGGVSYGVAAGSIDSREIKNNSVDTVDIRNGTIQGRDVLNGTLQSRDIANATLQSRDVRDGALRGADVNDRSLGGTDLADDTLGAREINEDALQLTGYVSDVVRVQTQTAQDGATTKGAPPARCPAGRRLLGGGAQIVADTVVPVALSTSAPTGRAWRASAYWTTPTTTPTPSWRLVAYAICG